MIKAIDDNLVDSVVILIDDSVSPVSIKVETKSGLENISNFLTSVSWVDFNICAKCVYDQIGFGNDFSEFNYNDDRGPDEEPFEGVRFLDMGGQVVVSLKAFERLMLRYFDFIIQIDSMRGADINDNIDWQEFLEYVEKLRKRVELE